ncbi:MAG: hypothetical protein QGH42_11520 [Kiritimatiellia bacterium]|jgi:hypothetical protein|nr:hypothetical protein [Candidatus Brocadiia bacterium]MDP6631124.1 hypothetical protein [Kiritimatiellia bacterium]MDP6810081.1 hypothetical protein [Kiritimatiellia bacterium]MDP7024852.1 hypothetical protein [Kiritimatiellia bacterium]
MRKWITLIFILAVLGGGLAFLIIGKRNAEREAYLAALAEESAMKACAEDASGMVTRLRHASEKLSEHSDTLYDALVLADSAVEFVTGKPAPKPVAPKPKPTERPPRDKPAPERAERSADRDDGLPPGMLSREELERRRNRGKKPAPKAEPDSDTDTAEPSAEPVTAAPVPAKPKVRTVWLVAKDLKTQAERGQSAMMQAVDLAERSLELEQKVIRATDSSAAASRLKEMESIFEEMDECKVGMQGILSKLEKQRIEVERFTMRVAEERNSSTASVMHQAARADLKRRETADLTRLEGLRQNQKTLLTTHAYGQLAKLLEEQMASCQSEKGRAAFAGTARRCAKINWLRGYMIEQIHAEPLRWGWGLGVKTVDVTDASETGVTVMSREIAWSDVPVAQFAKWAKHYCGKYELPGRVLGKLELAMAAFLWEHDLTEEALDYKRKSIATWERLREEAESLLPE